MLNFVLINSKKEIVNMYKEIITTISMKNDFNYKCYRFNDDNLLENYIKLKHKHNIFFITQNRETEGIEIARRIRNEYCDISSFIVIINFDSRKIDKEIEDEFIYNTVIVNNIQGSQTRLTKIIEQILNCYTKEEECFTIRNKKSIYKIPYEDILYIEKEPNSKHSMVHCLGEIISVKTSLNSLKSELNNSFVQTHRSVIVNSKNVSKINLNEGKVLFKNNSEKYLVSRSYKKLLKSRIPNKVKN